MTALVPDDSDDYASTLDELKQHVRNARFQAQRAANTELLRSSWRIGPAILNRQAQQAWGSKVLERLAADLRAEFPTMKGFSRRNLLYMRSFAGETLVSAFRSERDSSERHGRWEQDAGASPGIDASDRP